MQGAAMTGSNTPRGILPRLLLQLHSVTDNRPSRVSVTLCISGHRQQVEAKHTN